MALNLETNPNMVLWQQYVYPDDVTAAEGFDHLVWQTKIINAHKFREISSEELTDVPIEGIADQAVTYGHVIANGRGYAIAVARTGNKTNVVRADQFGNPPVDFVLSSLGVLIDGTSPDISTEMNESAPSMPNWKWSYGPMNILKEVVTEPACESPTV